jgi:hypothetical protein
MNLVNSEQYGYGEKAKKKRAGCETAAESQSCSLPFRNESDLTLSAARAMPVRGRACNLPYDIRKARCDISDTPSARRFDRRFERSTICFKQSAPVSGAWVSACWR